MAMEGWPGLHGSHAHGRGTWNFKKGLGWILDCHACIGFYGYLAKACCWRNESGRLQHLEHLGHVGAGVGLPGKKTQSVRWKSESITRFWIICCIAPGSKLGSGWILNQWGCWPWAQILHTSKVRAHGELDFMKDKSDQLNTTLVAIISAHWPVRAIVKVASINIPSTRNHEFEAISQCVTLSPQAQIRTPNQQFKENPKMWAINNHTDWDTRNGGGNKTRYNVPIME